MNNKCQSCNKQPSIIRKAINFGGALVRHVADGLDHVPEKVSKERLFICRGCPFRDPSSKKLICTHKDCGCYLDTKVTWASEKCPIGLWDKYTDNKDLDKNNNVNTPES